MSPECIQPSLSMSSDVPTGSRKYPLHTLPPFTRISPSSAMLNRTSGIGRPTVSHPVVLRWVGGGRTAGLRLTV